MAFFVSTPGALVTAKNAFSMSKKPPLMFVNPDKQSNHVMYSYNGITYNSEEQFMDNLELIKEKAEELKAAATHIFCAANGELAAWVSENLGMLKFGKLRPIIQIADRDIMIQNGRVVHTDVAAIIGWLAGFVQ